MNISNRLQDDARETQSSTIFAVLLEEFVKKETPGKQFEIEVFVVIVGALDKRIKAYQNVTSGFRIFGQLKSITAEEVLKETPIMVSAYANGSEDRIDGELVQFDELLKMYVWLMRLTVRKSNF